MQNQGFYNEDKDLMSPNKDLISEDKVPTNYRKRVPIENRTGKDWLEMLPVQMNYQPLVFVTCLLTFVGILMCVSDASADHISYIQNKDIRLGVDLDLGGAITYLSKTGSEENVVNSYDWGRQIQMSFYSGPIPYTPEGKQPNPSWAGLGWNPIQSGDCYGHRSKVLEYRNDGGSLYVKCIPMQWPQNDVPGSCTFESWITLKGNTAEVHGRINNHRKDLTQYQGRGQELPAIYTNGPYWRLMTYDGDQPFTNGKLTQIPAKMPWSGWIATENWAALVNDDNWGLGVYEPGTYQFIGGFAGQPGKGGPKDGPTGYIAPLQEEILDHNITYDFHYTLILGSLQYIRQWVYEHARKEYLPEYEFKTDRRHWHYVNATDQGWPIEGELNVKLDQNDPQLIGPEGFWKASEYPILRIEGAWHTGEHQAQVFWTRYDSQGVSDEKSLRFNIIADGQYHVYTVDLSKSPEYRGDITRLRIDPVDSGHQGDTVRIKSIRMEKRGSE